MGRINLTGMNIVFMQSFQTIWYDSTKVKSLEVYNLVKLAKSHFFMWNFGSSNKKLEVFELIIFEALNLCTVWWMYWAQFSRALSLLPLRMDLLFSFNTIGSSITNLYCQPSAVSLWATIKQFLPLRSRPFH